MARQIAIPGFRVDKGGRVVKNARRLPLATRIVQKAFKQIRVQRRGQAR